MKKVKLTLAISIFLLFGMAGCSMSDDASKNFSKSTGDIYLYGEMHGEEEILEKELALWNDYYHNEGMRHLFIEYPYYTAEFLNIWMKSDNDDLLNELYEDWAGTAAYVPCEKEFFKQIKLDSPETIFHGTDVGHHFETGERFLEYLEENGLENSEQYSISQEVIEQGKYFKENSNDFVYRENKMVENFIREFDSLNGESIMGIYGGAHTEPDAMDSTGTVPCMANQLNQHYGDIVYSEDLTWIRTSIDSTETVTIEIDDKNYETLYIGKQILYWETKYKYQEIWRLDNAYDDVKDNRKTGNILPYSNYPITIETGQVFVIDYIKEDGTVMRMYFRSDGDESQGDPITVEFRVK